MKNINPLHKIYLTIGVLGILLGSVGHLGNSVPYNGTLIEIIYRFGREVFVPSGVLCVSAIMLLFLKKESKKYKVIHFLGLFVLVGIIFFTLTTLFETVTDNSAGATPTAVVPKAANSNQ